MTITLIKLGGYWCWYWLMPEQAQRTPYTDLVPREGAVAYLRRLWPKAIIIEG